MVSPFLSAFLRFRLGFASFASFGIAVRLHRDRGYTSGTMITIATVNTPNYKHVYISLCQFLVEYVQITLEVYMFGSSGIYIKPLRQKWSQHLPNMFLKRP